MIIFVQIWWKTTRGLFWAGCDPIPCYGHARWAGDYSFPIQSLSCQFVSKNSLYVIFFGLWPNLKLTSVLCRGTKSGQDTYISHTKKYFFFTKKPCFLFSGSTGALSAGLGWCQWSGGGGEKLDLMITRDITMIVLVTRDMVIKTLMTRGLIMT